MKEERELIVEAQKGNREAFAILVRMYFKKIFRVAYIYLHNIHDAEDITQTAFLKAYSNIRNFDSEKPFFPWIYQITKNLSLNHIQREKLKIKRETDTSNYDSNGDKHNPELQFIKDSEALALKKALIKLDKESRDILILKHWNDCSYQEISEILSIPIGTVMSRLYYARKKLKVEILKMEEKPNGLQ